jgi:hypothetical protein
VPGTGPRHPGQTPIRDLPRRRKSRPEAGFFIEP